MKFTTLNFKHQDYSKNHEIFVGTQTGSFKNISPGGKNPYNQINLQDLSVLTKESKITALTTADQNDEILIGRENKYIQSFSTVTNTFESKLELTQGPTVGVGRYDDSIIVGIGSGVIEIYKNSEVHKTVSTGDHMNRMRQCPTNKNLFASGGKERQNNLKVFDINEAKETFRSKNLPNDMLQLEVPIWDSDLGFFDENILATCSRHGYVRVYDTRKQRRPILNYVAPEEQMSFCSLTTGGPGDNYIYCGSTMGVAKAFDIRKFKTFAHTYKGFTGSVSDLCIDESKQFLVSACLDRYVRVHETNSCVMMYQCYVKSKATRVCVKSSKKLIDNDSEENLINTIDENSDEEYEGMFANMPIISETKAVRRTSEINDDQPKKKKSKIK